MKLGNKVLTAFIIAFFTALVVYFTFRVKYDWVHLIVPEFLGVTLLAIIITIAVKKNDSVKLFTLVLSVIFLIGVMLFIYGRANDIQFLVDLAPELLGSTLIGIVFGFIFQRKITGF